MPSKIETTAPAVVAFARNTLYCKKKGTASQGYNGCCVYFKMVAMMQWLRHQKEVQREMVWPKRGTERNGLAKTRYREMVWPKRGTEYMVWPKRGTVSHRSFRFSSGYPRKLLSVGPVEFESRRGEIFNLFAKIKKKG